jgi:hypothetical protein
MAERQVTVDPVVELGASPRGSQCLVLVARSLAVLAGPDLVTQPSDVIATLLAQVPGPAVTASASRGTLLR